MVVEDREIFIDSECAAVLAQDARSEAVKGRYGHGGRGFRGRHFGDALPHFRRGLIGKGNGQDLRRLANFLGHQPRYSICQDTRFAASGARKHEKGTVVVENGFFLAYIELIDKY
jgi:hypothetical protein